MILSVCKREKPPWMTLASWYVLVSRVRTLDSLRLLQHDLAGLVSLSGLKHDEYLAAWEQGYDQNGRWSDELAVGALKELRTTRQRLKQQKAAATKRATAEKKLAAAASKKRALGSAELAAGKREKRAPSALPALRADGRC